MDYFDYEDDEINCLIDDTVQQIKNIMIDRCKEEIESDKRYIEYLKNQVEDYKKHYAIAKEHCNQFEKEWRKRGEIIEKFENSTNFCPYSVGDKVYVVTGKKSFVCKCSTCEGNGRIKKIIDDLEYSTVCPSCGGYQKDEMVRELWYNEFGVDRGDIEEIMINCKKDYKSYEMVVNTNGNHRRYTSDRIFSDKELAVEKAKELSREELLSAQRKTGNLQ